jgi:hypothetical protein
MSQPVELALIESAYQRLSGADAHGQPLMHGGKEVPVYTGDAPADRDAPYVATSRPRVRGEEKLDGTETPEVRLQLRAVTAFPPGKANLFKAYEIADAAHTLLEAAPISVGGNEPYIPEPDKQPIPSQTVGDREMKSLSINYRFPSL